VYLNSLLGWSRCYGYCVYGVMDDKFVGAVYSAAFEENLEEKADV